jgi:hypothetical protein
MLSSSYATLTIVDFNPIDHDEPNGYERASPGWDPETLAVWKNQHGPRQTA